VIELITNMAAAYAGMNSLKYGSGTVANGTVAQNAANRTSTMARANRFWVWLGGSVDSGTCWSFKTLFVITAASARESRWVPF
jgi:hypothetical protein